MTFLANENFPSRSTAHLRSAGFEVLNVLKGASDEEVIATAQQRGMIVNCCGSTSPIYATFKKLTFRL